jgi:hypothetical protein
MCSTLNRKIVPSFRVWWGQGWCILIVSVLCSLSLTGTVGGQAIGVGSSPVRISDVVISPDPFLIGQGPVTFSMLIGMPPSLNGANVLEVSILIASPTRRSMSFIVHRQPLTLESSNGRSSTIPVVLVWDGKDQYRNMVQDGSYYYEIRAKLMEDVGFGPRTKIVSHRVQGTLDVLAYEGEILPPAPPEPVLTEEVPEDLEIPDTREDLPGEEVPVMDEREGDGEDPIHFSEEEGGQDSLEHLPQELPPIPEDVWFDKTDDSTIFERDLPVLLIEGAQKSGTLQEAETPLGADPAPDLPDPLLPLTTP